MRNTIVRCLCIVLFGLLGVPGAADAQTAAYTNAPANLRAGPAQDYPLVAQLPEGTLVSVIGCISDYTWCDVAVPGLRGWIYAGLLDYSYQGGEVPLLDYGAELGFPIVAFAIVPYWDNFYRDRPFFHDRDRFMHRHAEPRIGPGGVGPGRGHPQLNEPPAVVTPGVGGRPPEHGGRDGGHETRPSATRGGWTGGIRTPAPAPAPMPAPAPAPAPMPAPQGGGNMHAPGPAAATHAPAPAVVMPPQGHQGGERGGFGGHQGGGGGERGSFGGRQGGGGGGGGGARGGEFRHE
ncbi:SH3 domain-containing protein [Burkholderia ubonensis]|uniref:SH3 domain-containing protein n=1 Tax=Burkholderia ubonensis TaxID=101571 RepID=UPI00075703A9|nr:SH3 domain-containing protein [Burkholderia ubonensis]KWB91004.1 peptide-binding protein [Burkholderia ubonensis]